MVRKQFARKATSPSNDENGLWAKVRKPVEVEVNDGLSTMNNELFIVYRLTFIVLAKPAS